MKRLKLELTSPRSGGDPQGGPADLTYTQEDDENQFSPLATARHGRCQEGGERKLGLVWRTSASDKGLYDDPEATPPLVNKRMSGERRKRALLVVDIQNDFITGSLAVKDAASVVTPINRLLGSGHFGTVVFSRDSHPRGHVSFASTHEGHKPFTTVHLPNPPSASGSNPCSVVTQELWPDHCVVGEPGWHFHPELHIHRADAIIDKGHAHDRDSYSAFYKEEDHHSHTMLGKALADRGVKEVYVVGLAYDYCVGSTAIDAARHGFEAFVIENMSRGVMAETCETMTERMLEAGVKILESFDVTGLAL